MSTIVTHPDKLVWRQTVFLAEAVALFIEDNAIEVEFPEYNPEHLTDVKKAILGENLFAFFNLDHAGSEIPEVETYIMVTGQGSERDFTQSKRDKSVGQVLISVASPNGEQTVRVIDSLYTLFESMPGFIVKVENADGECIDGMFVKGVWPTDGSPDMLQKTDSNIVFGFGIQVKYGKFAR